MCPNIYYYAEVVKLVDTHVSGACGASCAGSSPAFGTNTIIKGCDEHPFFILLISALGVLALPGELVLCVLVGRPKLAKFPVDREIDLRKTLLQTIPLARPLY